MLKDLIENWVKYCKEENFIGIGSTRKVYRIKDYVIKLHIHPLGYKQSLKEMEIWNFVVKKDIKELFAKIYYVDESVSVQRYYKPLELRNNQSFDIDVRRDQYLIPNIYEEVSAKLDKVFDCLQTGVSYDDKRFWWNILEN